jgi:hypothetical protein
MLVGVLSRLASALGLAALAAFAHRAYRVWDSRPEPIDVRSALTHPHLLEMTRDDRRFLFVSAAIALLCLAAVPLLRAGVARGARGWRGALVAAAAIAVVLMGAGAYRYKHPATATACFPVRVHGVASSICRPRPRKGEAIRQARYLGYGAAGVLALTLASVPLLRARRHTTA